MNCSPPGPLDNPWGLSRQEYWSGLPCPLPNPAIEPRSPALQVDSWSSEPPGLLSADLWWRRGFSAHPPPYPPVQICPHALHLPWCHLPWKVTSSHCVWSSSFLCSSWDSGNSTSRSPGVWGPRMAGGGDGSIGRARPEGGPWWVRQGAVWATSQPPGTGSLRAVASLQCLALPLPCSVAPTCLPTWPQSPGTQVP